MNADEWLDKTKKKLSIDSDYKLAKLIGIGNGGIANIRKRNGMDNYTAVRIAELLEIERMKVIIDMEIQKAKTAEKKEFWQKKANVYL